MNLSAFTKSFGGQMAVAAPDLTLQTGTLYAVIGANGSGKSTFSRVIAGVLSPDSRRPVTEPGLRVGYLPQKSYGYRLSVLQNLLLVNRDRERAARLLEAVQLSHLAGKPAHRLSGGETARMALARLFMGRYDLVILDEPTASCIYTQKGNKKIRKPQAANQTALIFDRRAAARLLSINSIRRLCWS